jgi:outer membrane lipoprotein-sorting protein
MKKLMTILLAVAIMGALFPSCKSGGDPKEDAKTAASSFLNSIKDMDYTKAKEFGTENTAQMLEMMSSFTSMMPDSVKEEAKKITFDISEVIVSEAGDAATVKFAGSDAPGKTEEIKLVLKDKKWLVDMEVPQAPQMEAPAMEGTEMPAEPAMPEPVK